MLLLLPLLHFVAAVVCLGFGRRGGRWVLWPAAVPLVLSSGWLAARAPEVLDGATLTRTVPWVEPLGLSVDLRLDAFGLFAGVVVSGVGLLVLAYSASYFRAHDGATRPDLSRLVGYLVAFAGSMSGLVLADGLFTLFLFWELTSVTSFLLIGIDDRRPEARDAARRALLVTGAGGLAMLAGLVVVGQAQQAWRLSQLAPFDGVAQQAGLALVLVGAVTKSAQIPFHFWLPGAMSAPTPVSAYLHSATMVKAGVILVARLAPLATGVGWWRPTLVVVGGLTMLVGGAGALRQYDAKLVLAHGTVSQLGFLMVLVGFGDAATTFAGVAVFGAHAMFKAALFLSVGVVDHELGTRDLRRIRRLGTHLPVVAATLVVAGASMAGIPPLLGFVAKEKALDALAHAPGPWGVVALVVVAAGSVLTVAYTARLLWGLLGDWAPGEQVATPHRAPGAFVAPGALLALSSVVGGMLAGGVGAIVAEVAGAVDPGAATKELHLWAGWNVALGVSVGALVGGALLARVVVARETAVMAAPPPARGEAAFASVYEATLRWSRRVTRVTQSGSLPAYVAVVLVVVVAALGVSIAVDGGEHLAGDAGWVLANSWLEAVTAVVTVGLALGVLATRRRIDAALLLGAVGFGVAAAFLVQGAPDLALTQVLVETLSIVLFVLVLRHLPSRFSPGPAWAPTPARVALSVGVGLVVAVFALITSNAGRGPSVAGPMIARSLPEGGGRNVVNVILVDIRGFDTMGEITVVAVAAVGVVNLVAAARRAQRAKHLVDGTDEPAVGP